MYEQFLKIPADASVSAQSPFLPHLAYRDKIYQFPIIKDAEFIIYSDKEDTYPMNENTFHSLTLELENSNQWTVTYKEDGLTILKKK